MRKKQLNLGDPIYPWISSNHGYLHLDYLVALLFCCAKFVFGWEEHILSRMPRSTVLNESQLICNGLAFILVLFIYTRNMISHRIPEIHSGEEAIS